MCTYWSCHELLYDEKPSLAKKSHISTMFLLKMVPQRKLSKYWPASFLEDEYLRSYISTKGSAAAENKVKSIWLSSGQRKTTRWARTFSGSLEGFWLLLASKILHNREFCVNQFLKDDSSSGCDFAPLVATVFLVKALF